VQSLSVVHWVRQAVAPQTNGAQSCCVTAGHAELEPLHTPAGVCLPLAHEGGLHCVPLRNVSAGQVGLVPSQTSGLSQTPLAARHWVPALPATFLQPVVVSQVSTVQGFESLQFGAAPPTQVPPAHLSDVVQALLSLHGWVLFPCVQPFVGSHASSVHTLPSSQFGAGPPTQDPEAHLSEVVQALPSSQALVLSAWLHPVAGRHVSSVQGFLSSQLVGDPPRHVPPEQVSDVVQALPSSHEAVLFVYVQPFAASHESFVHTLPSLQFFDAVPEQDPPAHTSPIVQASLSLQLAVLFVCTQPVDVLQESSVQALPSSQLTAVPLTQLPFEQTSPVVQALPSLQGPVLFVCVQPVEGLQASVVQGLLSLQFGAAPPVHVPFEQTSPVVQALPSLQVAVLLVCTHPVALLHESLVQGLLSSQFGAAPPTQAPPEQVSPVVQALPSLQLAVLFVWVQPVAGLQASVVQGLLSLQFAAVPPTQAPPEQVSPVVQALPSLQLAVLLVWVQPVAGLQASLVQGFESSQFGAAPPTQAPPEQVSPVVQALPSLQLAVLLVWVQPVAGLQASLVQGFESSQLGAAPPTQAPPEQVSPVVQALPSLHDAVLFVCTHPVAGLQESSVHPFESLQFAAAPATHVPELHVSPTVHALPSLHATAFSATQTPEALHAWQSFGLFPPQAVAQQTPSTQGSPLPHIASRVHLPPWLRTPVHLFVARSQ
jgi:hypothetical protein